MFQSFTSARFNLLFLGDMYNFFALSQCPIICSIRMLLLHHNNNKKTNNALVYIYFFYNFEIMNYIEVE
jgi:hypothetical protein